MMKKRVKEGGALLLAMALALSTLTLSGVKAADAVDTEALCSVDFSIAGGFDELKTVDSGVSIRLYKVASVDASGIYTAEGDFKGLELDSLENDGSAADAWLKRAEEAKKRVTDTTNVAAETSTDAEGKASLTDIQTGLYLVSAGEVQSPYYNYEFIPYLISLPNNYYYAEGDDSWVYDLIGTRALSLKPEQTERYGSLVINKELVNQNVTFGENATFVFQIEITTLKNETSKKQIAITFDAAESKSAAIEKIPAGSTVTVSEIYSGAGYKLSEGSQQIQQVTIAADESVSVSYRNEHDGHLSGGYGVVNNFKLNEINQYDWEKMEDNSGTQE